jgi:hypothetical protein
MGTFMGGFGLNAFRVFVLLLGIWTGAGIHDSISNHFAWHADPVAFAARPILAGMINPWPFTTMALMLATIAGGVATWRYRGVGRRDALVALGGAALIIIATLAWFVPQLGLMFASNSGLTEAEFIAHSRMWITLNAVRQLLLVVLFWYALLALGRIGGRAGKAHEREAMS